jgi:hypothetical protein
MSDKGGRRIIEVDDKLQTEVMSDLKAVIQKVRDIVKKSDCTKEMHLNPNHNRDYREDFMVASSIIDNVIMATFSDKGVQMDVLLTLFGSSIIEILVKAHVIAGTPRATMVKQLDIFKENIMKADALRHVK